MLGRCGARIQTYFFSVGHKSKTCEGEFHDLIIKHLASLFSIVGSDPLREVYLFSKLELPWWSWSPLMRYCVQAGGAYCKKCIKLVQRCCCTALPSPSSPSIQSFDKFSFMVLPFVATVYYSGCWASSRAAHQPFHHSLVWSQIMYIHGLAGTCGTYSTESRKMVAKEASLYHHKEQENIRRDSRSDFDFGVTSSEE